MNSIAEFRSTPAHQDPQFSASLHITVSALAYFTAQELAFMFPNLFGLMSAIWPAAGIALAALLLSPRRVWPLLLGCLFAAGLAANLTTTRPILASVGFMLANFGETVATAWLITRACGFQIGFTTVKEIMALVVSAILVNSVTSLFGAGVAEIVIGAQFTKFYWTWWVADGLGLLLITPLIVIWARSWRALADSPLRRKGEAALLIALAGVVAWNEFGTHLELAPVELAPFWLPVFLIWTALRCGPLVTVTLLSVFSIIAIGCTAAGLGSFPLGGADETLRLLAVQVYLGVIGMTGMVLATAIAQQREAQALLRAVVEGTSDAVYVKDRYGRYLLFNSAAARFVGKPVAEVIGRDDTFLFPALDAKAVMEGDRISMEARGPRTYEEHVSMATGGSLDFLSTKGPLRDEIGTLIGLFGIARDVTARKQVEAALKESELFSHSITNSIASEIVVLDRHGIIIAVNEAWNRFAAENSRSGGRPPPQTGVGANYLEACRTGAELPAHDGAMQAHAGIAAVIAGKLPSFSLEYPCHGPDAQRWFSMNVTPLGTGDRGVVVAHTNITERKRIEASLRASEERYRSFIQSSLDGLLLGTADGKILSANAAACRIFGYTEVELCNLGRNGIVDLQDPRLSTALTERQQKGGFLGELNFRRKNGTVFPAEISTAVFRVENGTEHTSIFIHDITARKQAEAALRASEEKFAKVFRRAPVLIVLADAENGICVDVNDEVLRVSGFTRGEIIGRPTVELGWLSAEERSQLVQGVMKDGRVDDMEMVLRTKSGECRHGLVSCELMDIGGRPFLLSVTVDITESRQTEEALRLSEGRYQLVERAVQDGLWDWNPFTQKTYLSPRWKEIIGFQDAELPSDEQTFFGRIHPEDQATAGKVIWRHLEQNERYECELRLRHKDGSYRWVLSRGEAVRDASGKPVRMVGSITDITERKLAVEGLLESEKNYRRLFDGMLDGFALHEILCDAAGRPVDYRFLSVNPSFERLTGLRAADTVGRTVLEILPQTEARWIERYGRVALTGEGIEFEEFSGVLQKHFEIAAFRPNPGQFATVFIDITEQKRAEAALRASEQRYRSILNASPDDITLTDIEGRILMVSPAGLRMFGHDDDCEAAGRLVTDFLVPEDRVKAAARMALMFQGVMPGSSQYRALRRDGSVFDLEVNSEFIRDNAGKPTNIIFIARDVTARAQAEARIALSARKLLAVLNASPLPHALNAENQNVTFLNAAFVRTFGYTLEEIPNLAAWWPKAYPDPLYRSKVAADWQAAIDESRRTGVEFAPFEVTIRCKDGTDKTVLVRAVPLSDSFGDEHLVVMQDITERKAAEMALARANDRLSLATRAGGVGIWDYDVRNKRLIWDELMYRLYGTTADKFGGDYVAWQKGVHPDDRARSDAEIQAALRGEKEFDTEFRALWPDGSVHFIRALSLVKRDANDQPLNMIGTNWDITAQKQAEESLQSSLHEKEALLKEVHHRVKNNLQVITSLLRLESGRSQQTDTKSVLQDMQGRIRSMAMLHESLYRSGTFAAVDLGVYLKQLSNQIFRALATSPGSIQLRLDLASVMVEMDQAMPCGLLVNELLSNSLKHGFPERSSGEIRVELQRVAGGPQLELRVHDTGVGLPADYEAKLHNSLGMQLVGDLTRQLEGTLMVGPGPGARFVVTFLPRPVTTDPLLVPKPAAVRT